MITEEQSRAEFERFYDTSPDIQGWRVDRSECLKVWQAALKFAQRSHVTASASFDDWPDFHEQGMGCGLEDRGITDRYEAMRYGWDQALERVAERLETWEVPIPPLPETKPQTVEVSVDPTGIATVHEKHPTPPEGYHLATEEERKCLPEGFIWKRKAWKHWHNEGLNFGAKAHPDFDYACPKAAPFRVTFTDGKINPPPFGEWHRSDGWTPEMVPEGWRPLLLGEVGSYEILIASKQWHKGSHPDAEAKAVHNHQRTRRPLPPPPAAPVEEADTFEKRFEAFIQKCAQDYLELTGKEYPLGKKLKA